MSNNLLGRQTSSRKASFLSIRASTIIRLAQVRYLAPRTSQYALFRFNQLVKIERGIIVGISTQDSTNVALSRSVFNAALLCSSYFKGANCGILPRLRPRSAILDLVWAKSSKGPPTPADARQIFCNFTCFWRARRGLPNLKIGGRRRAPAKYSHLRGRPPTLAVVSF